MEEKEIESLFGESIEIDLSNSNSSFLNKLKKVKTKTLEKPTDLENEDSIVKYLKSSKVELKDKLDLIKAKVESVLGWRKQTTLVIRDKNTLHDYISKAIENDVIAIDTETNNSIDPFTCKIMGLCIYTPNRLSAYVPINHTVCGQATLLENQLTEQDLNVELSRLTNAKIIMHNADFDYRVIKNTCNVSLNIYWDTMLATYCIDENDIGHAGLKEQYITKINPSQSKYQIDHLFAGVEYKDVDPDIFALYSATDAIMTYELYLYQKNILEKPENAGSLKVLLNVEMPLVPVVANMEDTGICIDKEYSERLRQKYQKQLDEVDRQIQEELTKLKPTIDAWRLTKEANIKFDGKKSKAEQLEDPINMASSTQMGILLYDILKIPVVNKKQPRSTDKTTLDTIADKYDIPLAKLKKKRAGIKILLDTFIEKLPSVLSSKDGRLHGSFNQYGAVTGRFSSSNPNLQNIPSKAHDIRAMFRPTEGYKLIGSDYSAQEPRLTTFMSKDKTMYKAYNEGKDLYCVIAQQINHNNYEDNLEYYPEGTVLNIDGKEVICGKDTNSYAEGTKRRKQAKVVLLALTYGMGTATLAERLNCKKEEAQEVFDNFFKSFPQVKDWVEKNKAFARKRFYVEDFYGRRRHLNDLKLKPFEASYIDIEKEKKRYFNPFLELPEFKINTKKLAKYEKEASECRSKKQFENLQETAKQDNISIISNESKIATAERQSVNAIIQGSASTLTKLAMIDIANNEELKKLGFRMLITIHDEVLGECPKENADKVEELLPDIMIKAAGRYIDVPMKCSPYNVDYWYQVELESEIMDDYKEFKQNLSTEEALTKLNEKHSQFTLDELKKIVL